MLFRYLPSFKLILAVFLLPFSASVYSECVILLHGISRTDSSMNELERKLSKESFTVINQRYPSRDFTVEVLAEKAITSALTQCVPEDKINFVTHLMGGILVRQYLSNHKIHNLNRVVMLGPPNQGSEVVDKLGNFPGFNFFVGDASLQLGTGEFSVPNKLGKANFDVGIIAGTKSINFILSLFIPGDDDGKVSIERTKLEGMSDHIEMPVSHPFMIFNDNVIVQVINYLKHGSFKREENL